MCTAAISLTASRREWAGTLRELPMNLAGRETLRRPIASRRECKGLCALCYNRAGPSSQTRRSLFPWRKR